MNREQKAAEPSPAGLEEVVFALEPGLHVTEFAAVFRSSTLAERRPLERPDVLERMLRGADVVVTARLRNGGKLIGVARSLTDFAYCTYLSDVAVDTEYQRRGIGKELIRRSHEAAGMHTTLILLAAPRAREYYPHIGMHRHDSCWTFPRYAPPEVLPVSPKGGSGVRGQGSGVRGQGSGESYNRRAGLGGEARI
jgi:GNAT superfamily N-acetyltransferase